MYIHKFYKKPSDDYNLDDINIEDRYPLYAFTDDKKMCNKFMKERNMDLFIYIKSEATKELYVNFANKYSGSKLDEYEYYYKDPRYISKKEKRSADEWLVAKIVSTWTERAMISDITEIGLSEGEGGMDYRGNPFILKKKYFNALRKLQYVDLWKVYTNMKEDAIYTVNRLGLDEETELDYSTPDISYDELELFLFQYGWMFS